VDLARAPRSDIADAPPGIRQCGRTGQFLLSGSQNPLLNERITESLPGRAAILHLWNSSYVQTYLERDVRSLRQIGDLGRFRSFLRAVAARTGQLLNLSDIARDLGVAVNTAKAWLSVLEATHQVFIVRPYFANIGKRLVKAPKVYFTDPGTLCHLTGLKDPEHARRRTAGGTADGGGGIG